MPRNEDATQVCPVAYLDSRVEIPQGGMAYDKPTEERPRDPCVPDD